MFVVSGGGNVSMDLSVRKQKRFQSALRKFQRFTQDHHVYMTANCSNQAKACKVT